MSDRPWMKFYPRDWRGEQALRAVSVAARGLWIECLCIMHEAKPYGHLLLNGGPPEGDALARMVGAPADEVSALMAELRLAGVLSVTRAGVVFSRRMVKDHARAQKGAKSADKRWSQGNEKTEETGRPNRYPSGNPITHKPEARVSSLRSETGREGGDARKAFDGYNERAGRVGWPIAETLNADRRKRLTARLAEAGGIDGFLSALDRATKSDFLVKGTEDSNWRPSLDFFLQPKSFTRLREGAYDNRAKAAPMPTANDAPPVETVRFDDLVDRYRKGLWGDRYGGQPGRTSCSLDAELQRRILIAATGEDSARRRYGHLFATTTAA